MNTGVCFNKKLRHITGGRFGMEIIVFLGLLSCGQPLGTNCSPSRQKTLSYDFFCGSSDHRRRVRTTVNGCLAKALEITRVCRSRFSQRVVQLCYFMATKIAVFSVKEFPALMFIRDFKTLPLKEGRKYVNS